METRLWIRPLNPKTRVLHDGDISLQDTSTAVVRPMRLFDIVALPLERAISSANQPENWLLQMLPPNSFPQLIGNAQLDESIAQHLRKIADDNASHPFLFGNGDAYVPHQKLCDNPLPFSLSLIRPLDLVWVRSFDYRGNPRMKAEFNYGLPRRSYSLPVTDIEYESHLLKATEKGSPRLRAKEVHSEHVSEILFVASLGEKFAANNCHYKLIAGVLEILK